MKKLALLLCSLAFVSASSVYAATATTTSATTEPSVVHTTLPKGVVARVNGVDITAAEIDFLMKQVPVQMDQKSNEYKQLREHVIERFVRTEIVVQQAKKDGFDKKPDFMIAKALSEKEVLVRDYVNSFMKTHPVTDQELQVKYEAMKKRVGTIELHLSHILVKTEKEANMVLADLKKGKKFADLAKKYSVDTMSKNNGGDLGWNAPSAFVPEFTQAAMKLKNGEYTHMAVKTKFGYHIIEMNGERPLKVPAFKDVKPQLTQLIRQEQLESYLKVLRAKSKVEM